MAWCGGSRTAQPESPDRGVLQGDSGYPPQPLDTQGGGPV